MPAFEHVYLIMMENTSQSAINATNAPYISSLMTTYSYTKNYSTTYHPSLPNYIDVTSGSNQGLKADGTPAQYGNMTVQHLGDQLDGAKITWREYAEGMGTACNLTDSGQYATKHVPFLFYKDVSSDTTTCQDRAVDYTELATDLTAPRSFNMISPNLCNDMHGNLGCPATAEITQGDTWLSTEVPKILATPGFQAGGKDVLFIVWDEQTGSIGGANIPMLCIPIGPLVKGGTSSSQAYTHESLLATFEEAFGLARLANAAQVPSPINDVWK